MNYYHGYYLSGTVFLLSLDVFDMKYPKLPSMGIHSHAVFSGTQTVYYESLSIGIL